MEIDLEKSILEHLKEFLLELGKGLSFVGNQVRLTLEEDHFYPDLIKCKDENSIVGILLSTDKNKTVVKYTLPENNKSIFASEYKLHLPTEEELIEAIEEEKKNL